MKNLFVVVVNMIIFLVINRIQCLQTIKKSANKDLQRLVTWSLFLENFKKVLLDKLELAEEPKINEMKLSPAEKEWARKTHEEIESKTDDQQQKLQIIYPQLIRSK